MKEEGRGMKEEMLCATTLGEVAYEIIDQSGPVTDDDFLYVDIGSIDRDTKKILTPKPMPAAAAPSRAKQVLQQGDVLVSMTRPNLNAVALVPNNLNNAIGSTGFHVLRSKWVDSKFLFYLVQSDNFVNAMNTVVQGALYPAVRPKDISSFKFLLPSSLAQARLVHKLEELLSDLDAGVAELKVAQKKLARYRQSLLKAAVEGKLTAEWRERQKEERQKEELRKKKSEGDAPLLHSSFDASSFDASSFDASSLLKKILAERRARWEAKQLAKFKEHRKNPPKDWQNNYPEPVQPDTTGLPQLPEGWVWASVDQLSESVRNGISKTPNTQGRGFRIFKINAVRPMTVNFDAIKHIEIDAAETSDYWVESGDVLATRYNGSVDLLGVFGMVREVKERTLHPDKLIRMKPILGVGLGAWMEVCGNVGRSRQHLVSRVKTTAGQTGISGEDLKKTPIPLPPALEQEAAIAGLDECLQGIHELDQPVELGLKQSTAQRHNILRAAFAGQLVPQDPNDEPASVLLERIRAERAKLVAVKKPRGSAKSKGAL